MKQRLELVDFLKGFSIFTIVVMHLVQYPEKADIISYVVAWCYAWLLAIARLK